MSINNSVLNFSSSVICISLLSTLIRNGNEKLRRAGLKGNVIDKYDEINSFECNFSVHPKSDILVVFENGLGSPLESWDYVRLFLRENFNIITYNRTGYGFTDKESENYRIIEYIIENNFKSISEVVFVAHSIGAVFAAENILKSSLLNSLTNKLILIDGTEPELLDNYRKDPKSRGEFIQSSFQKSLAGIFGFQWWGIDKYARRTSYRPDIQESVRIFNANPKEILNSFKEYERAQTESLKSLLSDENMDITVISSSERKSQQKKISEDFSLPLYVIDGSLHHSIIATPEYALQVSRLIRENIDN